MKPHIFRKHQWKGIPAILRSNIHDFFHLQIYLQDHDIYWIFHFDYGQIWIMNNIRLVHWHLKMTSEILGWQSQLVQFCSVAQSCLLFATPWTAARQASLSVTNSRGLLKLMSIESVMLSNHLILCHPLLLPPSIFPSIRVFSSESVLHIRWPKYWSFSFNVSPSNQHLGLISFRMDCLDLLAIQGTLKSLLQNQSSKA